MITKAQQTLVHESVEQMRLEVAEALGLAASRADFPDVVQEKLKMHTHINSNSANEPYLVPFEYTSAVGAEIKANISSLMSGIEGALSGHT
jgi:hypothetical protein